MRNTAGVTGGKPIAIWSQSISGVSAINPLVGFYDIHGRKGEVLFFYFVPDTTRDSSVLLLLNQDIKIIEIFKSGFIIYMYHVAACRISQNCQISLADFQPKSLLSTDQ
jgi:hypothetical protein